MTTEAEARANRAIELSHMSQTEAQDVALNILAEGFETGITAGRIAWSPVRARAIALLIANSQANSVLSVTLKMMLDQATKSLAGKKQ